MTQYSPRIVREDPVRSAAPSPLEPPHLTGFDPGAHRAEAVAEIRAAARLGIVSVSFLSDCLASIGDRRRDTDLGKIVDWLTEIAHHYDAEIQ